MYYNYIIAFAMYTYNLLYLFSPARSVRTRPLKFCKFSTFHRENDPVITEEKSGTQLCMEIRNESKGEAAHTIPEPTRPHRCNTRRSQSPSICTAYY